MKNLADIKKHALEKYPEECVGYVSNGVYHKLENVSNTPKLRYQLKPKDKLMIFNLGDKLTALVHSHPVLDNTPSEWDIEAQKSCGFPFWVIGTDGTDTTQIKEISL